MKDSSRDLNFQCPRIEKSRIAKPFFLWIRRILEENRPIFLEDMVTKCALSAQTKLELQGNKEDMYTCGTLYRMTQFYVHMSTIVSIGYAYN